MKLFSLRSILLGVVLALMTTVAGPAYAQSPQPDPKVQYPVEELEKLRGKLIEFADAIKDLSGLLADNGEQVKRLDQARASFEQLSLKDLNTYRAALDPARMNAGLVEARATIAEYMRGIDGYSRNNARRGATLNSAGLPARTGPSSACDDLIGSSRPTSDLIIATDAIYYTALGVHDAASRACNQIAVLVVLGEGGGANGSLACTIADGVFIASKIVRDSVRACDQDYINRTLDTSYERLDHLHGDVEGSIANDNANRAAIVNNDNANSGNIIVNGNSNTATINGATNTAKVELRDLILRTQIEADLSRADSSVPVGLYLTPTANGGYLNLVRTIVAQTIATVQAAGGSIGPAQSLLVQADTYKTAGDFKKAYTYYRKAFRESGK